MTKFTKDNFKKIAQKYGLLDVDYSTYLLLDCNLFFKFNDTNGYVLAHDMIPMELAINMYETIMDRKEIDVEEFPYSNCPSHALRNPMLVAKHSSMDIDIIRILAKQTGKGIETIWEEARQQALANDYDNCYNDFSYIYTPNAFALYIETVQNYYNKKKKLVK